MGSQWTSQIAVWVPETDSCIYSVPLIECLRYHLIVADVEI